MKVLHVIPGLSHRYGGPAAAIRAMSESLTAAGLDLELASTTADGPGYELTDEKQAAVGREFSHPIHLFPRNWSEQWKYAPQLRAWLYRNVKKFDLVHIHALWSYSSLVAARAARRENVPYIVRPAGMLSDYTFRNGFWKKQIYWNLLERRTVLSAAVIHATSREEKADVLKRSSTARVHVIPNGVNKDAWTVPHRDRQHSGVPHVLLLSRLHPVKGIIDYLIPAFEKMSVQATLQIAGGADPHMPQYADAVRQRVQSSPRSGDIELPGEISADDRWRLFDEADLFVLPSHSENFGIVVAEAFSRQCAVVVSDRVQSCEHVVAAKGGAVVPLDVDKLAGTMDDLLRDRTALAAQGLRGQQYAKANLSWTGITEQIINMYDGCIRSSV